MPATIASREGLRLKVRGLVQGVGFRPTVWRLARDAGLDGHVLNDGAGVTIEIYGDAAVLARFESRLRSEPMPLARIDHIACEPIAAPGSMAGFRILDSEGGPVLAAVAPDAATCPACLAEVLDPEDRRHGYPFANCTHCGPRLSIVRAIPYDRGHTAMASFAMCDACRREYDDPADRRFHAQPVACPDCGPRAWLETADGRLADAEPIGAAAGLIRDGAILAIKGLGGFHLACDATNGDAVRRLRQRKRRDRKPFAVMVASVEDAAALAVVGADERAMLEMPAAPIVLLEPRAGGALADGVAPGQSRIGVMLAYTPLHHLLMRALAGPAVMTSGNLSSEPQCTDNDAARRELAGIADAFLLHDREIVHRVDDSLVRADAGSVSMLRRARGYAPQPLPLAADFRGAPPVLALGGELKSTFCFLRDGAATVSQHLGDLEHAETHRAFRSALALYRGMFALEPRIIAIDRHPDYLSSQWGAAIARETGAALVPVQHHHAHLAAVLAEHGVSPDAAPVLGIILDGTGLGDDATIWGGEFLLGGYARYERLAHLEPVRLPGGAAAVREPWRNTLAHLVAATGLGGPELAARSGLDWLRGKPVAAMQTMLDRGINAPLASSAGRAFDAVAGAIGLCRDRQDYEGQAAMELETLALSRIGDVAGYPFRIAAGPPLVLGYGPMWRALLDDLAQGASPEVMAARFHRFLIDGIVETAVRLGERHRFTTIALSGGVFQNRILLLGVRAALEARGLAVLVPRQLPANDGGLSLGQAASAAVRAKFWFEGQNRLSLDAGSQVCRANPEAR